VTRKEITENGFGPKSVKEVLRRCGFGRELVGVFALDYSDHCLGENSEVKVKRPGPHVFEVIFNALLHLLQGVRLPAPAIYLGQARDAGTHLVTNAILGHLLFLTQKWFDRKWVRSWQRWPLGELGGALFGAGVGGMGE